MEDLVVVYDGADSAFRRIVALALEPDGKVVGPEDARMVAADLYLVDERPIPWTKFIRTLEEIRLLGVPLVIVSARLEDWIVDLVLQGDVVGFVAAVDSPVILRRGLAVILSRLEG